METPSKQASSRYSSPSEFNNNNLRDDSFSSYLALMKQSFSNNDPASSNPRPSSLGTIIPPATRASKDNGELDVFGAEKYFSGTLDIQDSPAEVLTSDSISKLSERTKKPSNKSRLSSCSDISATNSHSVLLRDRLPPHQGSSARCRRYTDFFRWCSCSRKNDVEVEDVGNRSNRSLHKESSSELFEIDSVSMGSHPVYEPSEVSIQWSVATASASEGVKKERRSLGLLNFGSTRDKSAGVAGDSVGAALERYHIMMDLDPVSVVGVVAARPRRASLG